MSQPQVVLKAAKNYRDYPIIDKQLGPEGMALAKQVFTLVLSQQRLDQTIKSMICDDGYDPDGKMVGIFIERIRGIEDQLKALEEVHGPLTDCVYRT